MPESGTPGRFAESRSSVTRASEEIDPNDPTRDELVDVQGEQAEVEWTNHPLSDDLLSPEARKKLARLP